MTPSADGVLTSACVVELTHLASLYHDDVMDEADLRRGAESANARWDNHVAILTGDFLFSKSSELTAGLGPDAVRIQAQTFTRLVEGQILETLGPTGDQDPLEHYLRVVAGKTGSLIATSARYGAMFAGAPVDVEEALTEYGEKVGVAFQLSDDILDIASETEESGKTPGTDLREGVPTLPVLIARRSTDPADARLLELLGSDLSDDEPHAEALPCCAHTRRWPRRAPTSSSLAAEAKELLKVLPEGARTHRSRGLRRRGRHPLELTPVHPAPPQMPGTGPFPSVLCRHPHADWDARTSEGSDGDVRRNATATAATPAAGTGSGGGYEPAPPPPPGYGQGPGYGGQPPGTNKKAIWALVLGILGLLCCGILGIPAIILGKQAQNEIDTSGGMQTGRGMATAGFVLGIIACVLLVVTAVLFATGNNPYANLS